MKKSAIAMVFAMMFVLVGAAIAQDSKQELSVSVSGVFTKSTSDASYQTTSTKTAGLQAQYAYYFGKFSGVQATYGYSRFGNNITSTSTGTIGDVQSNVSQFSLAYVAKFNKKGKFSPFFNVGGGSMVFSPTTAGKAVATGVGTQARATLTYGAGVDYNVNKRWSVRAAYNGLFYKMPTYGSSLVYSAYTNTSEPTLGVVFHF